MPSSFRGAPESTAERALVLDGEVEPPKQRQVHVKPRNFVIALGTILIMSAVSIPVWDSFRLMADPTFVFFVGRGLPTSIIWACVGCVVVYIFLIMFFFACAREEAKTDQSVYLIFAIVLGTTGLCLMSFSMPLKNDVLSAYEEVFHNCQFGPNTQRLYEYSTVLQGIRATSECSGRSSVAMCDGFQESMPYTGFLKSMETQYQCAGFCYGSSTMAAATVAVAAEPEVTNTYTTLPPIGLLGAKPQLAAELRGSKALTDALQLGAKRQTASPTDTFGANRMGAKLLSVSPTEVAGASTSLPDTPAKVTTELQGSKSLTDALQLSRAHAVASPAAVFKSSIASPSSASATDAVKPVTPDLQGSQALVNALQNTNISHRASAITASSSPVVAAPAATARAALDLHGTPALIDALQLTDAAQLLSTGAGVPLAVVPQNKSVSSSKAPSSDLHGPKSLIDALQLVRTRKSSSVVAASATIPSIGNSSAAAVFRSTSATSSVAEGLHGSKSLTDALQQLAKSRALSASEKASLLQIEMSKAEVSAGLDAAPASHAGFAGFSGQLPSAPGPGAATTTVMPSNISRGTPGYVGTYPPTLFSTRNYQVSCEGMVAQGLKYSGMHVADMIYWEGVFLLLTVVVGGISTMCGFCVQMPHTKGRRPVLTGSIAK